MPDDDFAWKRSVNRATKPSVQRAGLHTSACPLIPCSLPDPRCSRQNKSFRFEIKLVYLIGNNAAKGENYIKYANSYLMKSTVNNTYLRLIEAW